LSYADDIEEVAASLQSPLLDWIAAVGRQYGASLDWWMTSLAGRSLWQIPLCVSVLHLSLLDRLLEVGRRAELVVVCEDWFLLAAAERLLHERGKDVRRGQFWRIWLAGAAVVRAGRVLGRGLRFARQYSAAFAAARLTRVESTRPPCEGGTRKVLLHTCIDDTCLGEDGALRDRYFGRLRDWLTDNGVDVTTVPWIYNTQRSAWHLFRWLRRSKHRFLIVEDYLTLRDYAAAVWHVVRSARVPRRFPGVLSFDVHDLVWREWIANGSAFERIRFLLYVPAFRRWLAAGNRCDVYIDMFENMYPERPPVQAFRRWSPATLTVGYQHASIPGESLAGSVTREDWRSGVFPDRIVATGTAAAELLIRRGFPAQHVVAGPALRLEYLMRHRSSRPGGARARSPKSVLVLLPLDLPDAVEVLMSVMQCAGMLHRLGATAMLRNHPMAKSKALLRACTIRDVPDGWRVVGGPLESQLREASIAVGLGTAALIDAAAYGVPTISLGRELTVGYNPLQSFAAEFPWCRTTTPSGLQERLEAILTGGVEGGEAALAGLSSRLRAGLGEVDDAHLSAFIEG
jgi:surface carbohydrate biosynthesis protein (TIGR04326 family)